MPYIACPTCGSTPGRAAPHSARKHCARCGTRLPVDSKRQGDPAAARRELAAAPRGTRVSVRLVEMLREIALEDRAGARAEGRPRLCVTLPSDRREHGLGFPAEPGSPAA